MLVFGSDLDLWLLFWVGYGGGDGVGVVGEGWGWSVHSGGLGGDRERT